MADVHVSPYLRTDLSLAGFVIGGRWPASTGEWAQFLLLAVRLAARPGCVPRTAVFCAIDDVPDDPPEHTVGMVTCAGPVIGTDAPAPGALATPQPTALLVLHPPDETRPSTPDCAGAASGALLLPGLPHLGLAHRATWVEATANGTLTRLVSRVDVNPADDPDIAVLATLASLAA